MVGGASSMKADVAEALFYADMLKSARSDAEREGIQDHVARLAEDRYEAATGEDGRVAALRFNKTANGKLTVTATHIEAWLATLPDKPATITAKRRVATVFADNFSYIEEVETRLVQAWLTETARVEKMATPTVDRLLSFSRGYWRYLMDTGVIETNPLRDVRRPAGARKVQSWVPFTPLEVVTLRAAAVAGGDAELADTIELGMWTGGRIDELGGLKVEEVDLAGRSFKITSAKTAAGIREVPIHLKLLPTLKRLIGYREPPRVCRRLLGLSHAASLCSSSMA
jgi:integrase